MKKKDKETEESVVKNTLPECPFESGDIIVNEEFSVIGIFCEELTDIDEQITFPSFYVACSNGVIHENFDDLDCDDWPGDYRLATDEEAEIFLGDIEDLTDYVWNNNTKMLETRNKDKWMIKDHFYPKTWEEATQNYTECHDLDETLICCDLDGSYSDKAFTFAQLKLLAKIYNFDNENKAGEVSYAVTVTPEKDLECRPYIYGKRNSALSFRYKEQAAMFMSYFESMIEKCAELV